MGILAWTQGQQLGEATMAESTYYIAYMIKNNVDLMNRVAASAQQESEAIQPPPENFSPEQWAQIHSWEWATQSDWITAVQSAIDAGITAWGQQPNVVTDQMILSYVQAAIAKESAA